jgi:biotin transport system substrate-specific component
VLFRVFGCSLLVALCARVALPLPWTPVPLTLQTLGVLLTGILLPPASAAGALLLYLGFGAAGFPLFAPTGPGGAATLMGPSAGYLMGFPPAAALISWLFRRLAGCSHVSRVSAAGMSGMVVIYLCGVAWLSAWAGESLTAVLVMGVYPFLLGDLLKLAAAAVLTRRLPIHE